MVSDLFPGQIPLAICKEDLNFYGDCFKAHPMGISRGSPQGSVLGCLLYCITTQLLTKDLRACQHLTNFFPQDLGPDVGVEFWERDDSGAFLSFDNPTLLDSAELSYAATIATAGGDTIKSVEQLKLVGSTFGGAPGAGALVDSIKDKYRRKRWMLYHLRDSGFRGLQLFKLYCCYIRSVIEYCSPVYHSLLNQGQEVTLEKLQRHALRVCFGYERPMEEWMEMFGISSLKERSLRRCDAFIRKAVVTPGLDHLGPPPPPRACEPRCLRSRRGIQETQATSLRRFNSPLAFLSRRVNAIGVIPGSWV